MIPSEFEYRFTPTPDTPIPGNRLAVPPLRHQVDEVARALMLAMRWGRFDSIDYSVIRAASEYVEGWQRTLRESGAKDA